MLVLNLYSLRIIKSFTEDTQAENGRHGMDTQALHGLNLHNQSSYEPSPENFLHDPKLELIVMNPRI